MKIFQAQKEPGRGNSALSLFLQGGVHGEACHQFDPGAAGAGALFPGGALRRPAVPFRPGGHRSADRQAGRGRRRGPGPAGFQESRRRPGRGRDQFPPPAENHRVPEGHGPFQGRQRDLRRRGAAALSGPRRGGCRRAAPGRRGRDRSRRRHGGLNAAILRC